MLYVYFDFMPNYESGIYYLASNKSLYIEYLNNTYNKVTFTIDNYRINNNLLRLTKSLPNPNPTYIYDELTGKFYNVRSVTPYGNYTELNIENDLWANNIYNAFFRRINLLRSNRQLGIGIYDAIKNTNDSNITNYIDVPDIERDENNTISEKDAYAVIVVSINRVNSILSGAKITHNYVLATSINNLRIVANRRTSTNILNLVNGVSIASDIVGGIYECEPNQTTDKYQCEINNLFIVPYNFIELNEGLGSINFYTKSYFTANNAEPINFFHVKNITKTINLSINTIVKNHINFDIYVGTKNTGLKIERKNSQNIIYYKCITNTSGLNIYVGYGDIQKEITQAFGCDISTNNASQTSLQKMQKALNIGGTILTSALGTAGILSSKNPAVFAMAGGIVSSGLSTAAQLMPNNEVLRNINGGDGASTFYTDIQLRLNSPFVAELYHSQFDEIKHACLYGLNYDLIPDYNDLYFLNRATFVHSDVATDIFDYVKANCIVANIPLDAINYITTILHNGIFLKFI